jgi:hypothetical protein
VEVQTKRMNWRFLNGESMVLTRLSRIFMDQTGKRFPTMEPRTHLQAAMQWLCRAQDATPDGGVSRSYALRWMPRHERQGWLASYPETTGYIIPTFLGYFRLTGESEYRDRAIRMAHWEADVQMENGAVQGGVIGFPPTPAVFNTGQVLFGWTAAYRETKDAALLNAATRAANFLVQAQDDDGAWRRSGSRYARQGINAYDARTAWGLLEAHLITNDPAYREGAIRNLDFVRIKQLANGWFPDCCLSDDEHPLLHTIAYTIEGLLEASVILRDSRYSDAARAAADALLERQRSDGSLAGRFDRSWAPASSWTCLTGDAQIAIVWFRLAELTGDSRYFNAAYRMNRYLSATQDVITKNTGIRGGIKGSHPIWAEYGSFEYLNWAAKFFADSLMLEIRLQPNFQDTNADASKTSTRRTPRGHYSTSGVA